jgi:hypothetical protein
MSSTRALSHFDIGRIAAEIHGAYLYEMAHEVDGLTLRYTSRTSWKAEIMAGGRTIGVAPVTWTKGQRGVPPDLFQEVWFQHVKEMEGYRTSAKPFMVAVAIAKDYSKLPHEFAEFRQVLEVQSTGRQLSDDSIETRVIRRVNRKTIDT